MEPVRAILAFSSALAFAIVALVPTTTAAPGQPGPFAGALVEGQTNVHAFASYSPGLECILPVTWTVTVRYAPPTDTVGLEARGASGLGQNGVAQVSFEDACSTSFLILVSGVDVALLATYTVEVHSGAAVQ